MNDDIMTFAPDPQEDESTKGQEVEAEPWKVLIVDDDDQMHVITKFALKSFEFRNRKLHFISAYSGAEARQRLWEHPDSALIFLDVVMEKSDAGLEFVSHVRHEQKNQAVRIVLRTGQPGYAPVEDIIRNYDIDDYCLKTDMTHHKMGTVVTVALRSYANIMALEEAKRELTSLNNTLEEKVSERTKDLVEVNARLRDHLQEKRALVRTLSHDLRNYLNIITGSVNLRKKYAGSLEKTENLWLRVEKAAAHQEQLIGHILELEAVSSGKKSLSLKKVDLRDVFEQGFFSLKDSLYKKSLQLSFHSHCGEALVLAEQTSLCNSVFNNVLANAIKFSPEGKRIRVEIFRDYPTGMICMTIEDQGIGMPESIRKNLFRGDVQTTRPGTSGEKGTGFGMPIVRQYMELFGGSIRVASREHSVPGESRGTTVSLYFRAASSAGVVSGTIAS